MEKKRIISIIPARGGSKSIPHKNIVNLAGEPLIARSIKHSLACSRIDRTIVSTDDEKIAKISIEYGAEVPFMRPKEIAQDDTQDFPVFLHVLKWLEENEGYYPNIIVHLRPTSPIRPAGLIDHGIKLLEKNNNADCVRTVSITPITPYKMCKIKNRYLEPLLKLQGLESYNMPRQDLPKIYWHNGVLDVIRYETIIKKHSISGDNILPLVMSNKIYCIDIDSKLDILVAEAALKMLAARDMGFGKGG